MIISLCGNHHDKNIIINYFKEVYGNRLLICDYFKIGFEACIEYEKIKYDLMDECSNLDQARNEFRDYIDKIIISRINDILINNRDKIILLVSDNVFTVDVDKTQFFNKSDIKILMNPEDDSEFIRQVNPYDITKFDYVIHCNRNKKLVKKE